MSDLSAEHLIVGASLVGLALADQLLRRGADKVVLVEKEGEVGRARRPVNDLVLSSGLDDYRPLEQRGVFLLEEWESYLQSDPGYRRCGSVSTPVLLESEGATVLDADTVVERAPSLVVDPGDSAVFYWADGQVDGAAVYRALVSLVRRRGGHVVRGCEVQSIAAAGDGFVFKASSREGSAERVYLTAGAGNADLLGSLGLPSDDAFVAWHAFEFDVPTGAPSIIRLEDTSGAIVHDHGDGTLVVHLRAEVKADSAAPRVDWSLMETFRRDHGHRIRTLATAAVRRGNAEERRELGARAPGIVSDESGRVVAAGGFGLHRLPLALGIAEALSERAGI